MKYQKIVMAYYLVFQALIFAGPIIPDDFGDSAKIEDFEGLANVSFLSVINPSNPHYVVNTDYYFNGDFSLTFPISNPPDPEDIYQIGAVMIGDFSQGTVFWGLGHRKIESPFDVYSGTSYLGVMSGAVDPVTVTFCFSNPVYKIGAWVDSGQYRDTPLKFEIFDRTGYLIDSITTFSSYWTFVGLESHLPIYSVSITGFVPVVDSVIYEIPEPATLTMLVVGGLLLHKRRQ